MASSLLTGGNGQSILPCTSNESPGPRRRPGGGPPHRSRVRRLFLDQWWRRRWGRLGALRGEREQPVPHGPDVQPNARLRRLHLECGVPGHGPEMRLGHRGLRPVPLRRRLPGGDARVLARRPLVPRGLRDQRRLPRHHADLRHDQQQGRVHRLQVVHGLHGDDDGNAHLRPNHVALRGVREQCRLSREPSAVPAWPGAMRQLSEQRRLRHRSADLRSTRLHLSRRVHGEFAMLRRGAVLSDDGFDVRGVSQQRGLLVAHRQALRPRRDVRRLPCEHRLPDGDPDLSWQPVRAVLPRQGLPHRADVPERRVPLTRIRAQGGLRA